MKKPQEGRRPELNPDRYYQNRLSAERLEQCYAIAPPRVKQYLEAEIEHVLTKIHPSDVVLELGCGYGRVLKPLALRAKWIVGIDTSRTNLSFAQKRIQNLTNCSLLQMDAVALGFRDRSFDLVVCIQNGISAFKVNPKDLMKESLRVARRGGTILFSSYSEKFWRDRLEWFKLQAEAGLIGEIDWDQTREGLIICRDGFKATTFGPAEFQALIPPSQTEFILEEVDGSSLFCEIRIR